MRRAVPLRQRGLTLIELIIFIVVVSVALAGVLMVLNTTARGSADPVIRKQALAVVEAMLDEILSKSYQNDPNDANNSSSTLGCTPTTTPRCQANNVYDRANYNDVDDYNGWNQTGVFDQTGDPVQGLTGYRVSVAVAAPSALNGVTGKQVTVTVNGGAESVSLVGFRANF